MPAAEAREGHRALKVRNWRDVDERSARGALKVRRVFDVGEGGFESSFSFAQFNRIPPGGANETHNHDDIEKVHFVLQGEAVVECGAEQAAVKCGDFFFLPVHLAHAVRNVGANELQMIVFAARV